MHHRRRQKGIPTYAFWALALDPQTKRKVTTILWEIDVTTMWLDITDAIRKIIQLEETNITPQQQHNDNEEEEVEVKEPQQKKNLHFLPEWMTEWMQHLHFLLETKYYMQR